MAIKGMRDIKTHAALAREGKLVSAARDWHKRSEWDGARGNTEDWNPRVYRMEKKIRRSRPAKRFPSLISFFQDPNLYEKIKSHQIEELRNFLAELEQAIMEGLSVSAKELERIKTRLAELQADKRK